MLRNISREYHKMTDQSKPMTNEEENELEEYIKDWYYGNESHRFALKLAQYLFQFVEDLYCTKLSSKTKKKHIDNCWVIGKLECG